MEESASAALVPLLWLVQKACGSLYFLVEARQMFGAIILARAVLESVINALFIRAIGTDAASKAMRHARQKSYRDILLYRKFLEDYLDKEKASTTIEASSDLQELLDEFSFKSGKEAPYWTPESLHDRVNTIEGVFGKKAADVLRVGISAIYRHSSELLHGTLYGAMYALHQVPVAQNIESSEGIEIYNFRAMSTVSFLVICQIDQLIECFEASEGASPLTKASHDIVANLGGSVSFGNEV